MIPAPARAAAKAHRSTTAPGASSVEVHDLNGDFRGDVVAASFDNDTVAWFENVNGQFPGVCGNGEVAAFETCDPPGSPAGGNGTLCRADRPGCGEGSVDLDREKIEDDARFDGKGVLQTNMQLSAEQVAPKYKELWQVEPGFRDVKSVLDTRPVFHKTDETIRGHVFASFLALVLRKELDRRLEARGHLLEWSDIKQDLKALQEVTIEETNRRLAIRTACVGTCGKVFQAAGVAIPPAIREI